MASVVVPRRRWRPSLVGAVAFASLPTSALAAEGVPGSPATAPSLPLLPPSPALSIPWQSRLHAPSWLNVQVDYGDDDDATPAPSKAPAAPAPAPAPSPALAVLPPERKATSAQQPPPAQPTTSAAPVAQAASGVGSESAVAFGLPCGDLANLTSSVSSPGTEYLRRLDTWLREECSQPACAFAVVLLGAFCAWDGPKFWKALFTGAVALVVGCVAVYESGQQELPLISQTSVVAQAVGIAMLATWSGFEGTQVVLGAVMGYIGAFGFGGWARFLDEHLPGGFAVLWYSVGASFGILVVTKLRRSLLAAFAPLLGGFLLTVGVGTLASHGLAFFTDQDDFTPLPLSSMSLPAVAGALLGEDRKVALAGNGLCIGLVVLLQANQTRPRPVAVLCLVTCAMLTAAAAAMGPECRHFDGPVHCPAWMKAPNDDTWQWTVLGCGTWAVITASSAWRQLGLPEGWESEGSLKSSMVLPFTTAGLTSVPFGAVPCGGGGGGQQYSALPGQASVDAGSAQQNLTPSQRRMNPWSSSLGGS
mmetsp:Transcript_39907/g.127909  ORF Transcript_39907/g.127909 Transcript_39907/m.127909 type:complete len:533 (-) Transcript_39907:96-1694(-)